MVTFSSCYENEPMDERAYIEEMLAATGAERNYVFPDVAEFWEELPKIIWYQGDFGLCQVVLDEKGERAGFEFDT